MSNRSISISSILLDNLDSELEEDYPIADEATRDIVVIPKATYDEWAHALKSVVSSLLDVTSDWIYYFAVLKIPSLHRFVFGLYIICIVSTLSSISVMLMEYKRLRNPESKTLCGIRFKYFNAFEILFEDTPQIILTGWIHMDQNGFSTEGVFNLMSSAYNSFHGFLDLMRPDQREPNPKPIAVPTEELKGMPRTQKVETSASQQRLLW